MAQISSSAVENAKVISFSMENSLVSRYLQHASSEYTDGIGRTGNSVLCYWIYGEDKSPYMLQVPETDGHPGWPEQCAPAVQYRTSTALPPQGMLIPVSSFTSLSTSGTNAH